MIVSINWETLYEAAEKKNERSKSYNTGLFFV
jgi:hypothetical protein